MSFSNRAGAWPVLLLSLIAGAGCHQPSALGAKPQAVQCRGEPYLDTQNTTSSTVDIYASYDNGLRVFLGTIGPTDTRMTLAGTVLATHQGYVYGVVRQNAAVPNQSQSVALGTPGSTTSGLKLRQACDMSQAK
jgi:hypothetical protein